MKLIKVTNGDNEYVEFAQIEEDNGTQMVMRPARSTRPLSGIPEALSNDEDSKLGSEKMSYTGNSLKGGNLKRLQRNSKQTPDYPLSPKQIDQSLSKKPRRNKPNMARLQGL